MVEGAGFEPAKAEPSDLQSDPFGHSGTPPEGGILSGWASILSTAYPNKIIDLQPTLDADAERAANTTKSVIF